MRVGDQRGVVLVARQEFDLAHGGSDQSPVAKVSRARRGEVSIGPRARSRDPRECQVVAWASWQLALRSYRYGDQVGGVEQVGAAGAPDAVALAAGFGCWAI